MEEKQTFPEMFYDNFDLSLTNYVVLHLGGIFQVIWVQLKEIYRSQSWVLILNILPSHLIVPSQFVTPAILCSPICHSW